MTESFFNIWAFTTLKNCPNRAKVGSTLYEILNKP